MRAGFVGRMGPPARGKTISAEATAIFAAFTTPPTAERQALINTAVVALKSAGVWALLDSLQVYAAADSQAACVDWKVPSRVATPVNSPTFTADRGFTGDGATSYINTNYAMATGPNVTGTNSFMGGRVNSNPSLAGTALGGNTRYVWNPQGGANTASCTNASTTADTANMGNNNLRYILMRRPDTNGFDIFWDAAGVVQAPVNKIRAGASATADPVFVLCRNSGSLLPTLFTTREVSLYVCGAAISDAQVQSVVTAINGYMTGVGNTA